MRSTFSPSGAAVALAAVGRPWWIAGGHAIDLWLGAATRPHDDLDVAILRRDERAFRAALDGFEFFVGFGEGRIAARPLGRAEDAPPEHPALWARERGAAAWAFELLLSDAADDEWLFRRDHRVRRRMADIGRRGLDGVPFLRPEVVLLFKAKARRERDEADFARVLPTLDAEARSWLANALAFAHPAHPWLAAIQGRG